MNISKALDNILKIISISALIMMISLVFFNVILRYFFDSGIAWSEEFARICFVYMIFLGIILVAKERGHLIVDIITTILPARFQLFLFILSDILILIAMTFIMVGAYQLMELTYPQKMPATQISSAFLYLAAALSALVYFIMVLMNLFFHLKWALQGAK